MTSPTAMRAATWRRIGLWLAVAGACWLAARACERRTRIELLSTGSRVELSADGSSIAAPLAVEAVKRLEIVTTASAFPPGGRSLILSQGRSVVLADRLPSRFDRPNGQTAPVGDWAIDDHGGAALAYARDLAVDGPFELSAVVTGRPQQHLMINVIGNPTFSVSFRRGLINNDLFLWNADWRPLAVTSIDPEPAADALAALAVLLDPAAAAAVLIAAFLLILRLAPGVEVGTPPGSRGQIVAAAGAVVLAVMATALSLWMAGTVLERLPHLPDETVQLLQASWFSEGRLVQAASAIQDHLDIPFTYVSEGRWISHYPPGWPLLLAVGLEVRASWVLAPLLGGLYVLLIWRLGRELFDGPTGIIAAALAALSPMSRIVFGSHLSHAGSSTAIVLALLLLAVAHRRGWPVLAAGGGLGLALALAMRPLTAVAVAVPAAIFLVDDLRRAERSPRGVGVLLGAALGGLAGTLPLLWTNLVVTGHPLHLPYTLARGTMYGLANLPFGLRNLDAILASTVPALYGWGWGSSWVWLFQALPLAFAWIPFLLRRAGRSEVLLLGIVACLAAAHLGTRAHGLHGYGPRYLFDAFFAIFLLTARGVMELGRIGADRREAVRDRAPRILASGAAAAVLLAALCVPAACALPGRLRLYHGYNGVDASLERAIAEAGLERALIVFVGEDWQDWAMASRHMTGQLGGDLVFARSLDDNTTLWASYPDRPVYVWSEGRLEPVERRPERASRSDAGERR
jgi:4-amino-4-deoxy-L-arabinose transferase-like glycosyltransferase